MRNRFFSIADGMVWATLPIMGGLYYWEHTLRLTASGHKFIQVLLLPVVFSWAYFWNKHAEYERLRHQLDHKDKQTRMHYRQVTASSFTEGPVHTEVTASFPCIMAFEDEAAAEKNPHEIQYPFEVSYHVSNN